MKKLWKNGDPAPRPGDQVFIECPECDWSTMDFFQWSWWPLCIGFVNHWNDIHADVPSPLRYVKVKDVNT